MIEAINFIDSEESSEFGDRPWYKIVSELKEKSKDRSILEMAQRFLDLPNSRLFESLTNLMDQMNSSTVILKTELKVFKASYVDRLFRDVMATNNFDNYALNTFPFEENYPIGGTGIFVSKDFHLNPEKTDFENSQVLFEELVDLTPTQASDERLWTYLTHVFFWSYMIHRWPIEPKERPLGRIRDRYFLRGKGIESLTRNGISRLWWLAHISYDSNRHDRYELTKVLFSRADLMVGIGERAIGCNLEIVKGLLEFLKDNPQILISEDKTRKVIRSLNLVGGVKSLALLGKDRTKITLEEITKDLLT
ncbi:MAG: DUF6339 family protein [Bacteroidota bacterium]